MKTIGIVTIIDYYNYGNRLQNYALSHLLKDRMRCRVLTLEGYSHSQIEDNFEDWCKEQLALQLCRFPAFAHRHFKPSMIRWFNFAEWSRRWIPRKRFYSCNNLPENLNHQFDLFLSGSDQIWNYKIQNQRLDDYFLTFAEDKKKNSISASFGVERIPESKQDYYRKNLASFANISVREEVGARIVKGLIGRECPVLIDPVFMLSQKEWINVENKPNVDTATPYILKYFLGNSNDLIDSWANAQGYAIYDLMDKHNSKLYSSGPGEFISLIRNASLICSDSFHCIAFAIIFSKPFIVYERQGSEKYMGSRIESLLKKFNFENRMDNVLKPDDYLQCSFQYVKTRMEEEQNSFMDYLGTIIR